MLEIEISFLNVFEKQSVQDDHIKLYILEISIDNNIRFVTLLIVQFCRCAQVCHHPASTDNVIQFILSSD